MKTKEQLIELSKSFFKAKEGLELMYATSDNQFFYPEGKAYAYCHQRSNPNVVLHIIKRDDAIEPIEVKEEIEEIVEEIEEVAEVAEVIEEEIVEPIVEVIEEKIEEKPIAVKKVTKPKARKKSSRNKKK